MKLFDVIDRIDKDYYIALKDESGNLFSGTVCAVRYVSEKLTKTGYYEVILSVSGKKYTHTTEQQYEVLILRDAEGTDLFNDYYYDYYCLDGDIIEKIKEIIEAWDDYDTKGKCDMVAMLHHALYDNTNVIKLLAFLRRLYLGQEEWELKVQDRTDFMVETIKNVTKESGESIRFSLNNILVRITQVRNVKTDEDEELKEIEKVLNIVGISMCDGAGQYKESSQIIAEIAIKWDFLSNSAKKVVAMAVAGSYDYDRFIVLMDHWNKDGE